MTSYSRRGNKADRNLCTCRLTLPAQLENVLCAAQVFLLSTHLKVYSSYFCLALPRFIQEIIYVTLVLMLRHDVMPMCTIPSAIAANDFYTHTFQAFAQIHAK